MAKVPRVGGESKQPWSGCERKEFGFMTSIKHLLLLQKSSLFDSSEILAMVFLSVETSL